MDILKYRIPGEQIVSRSGLFKEIDQLKNNVGFVVGDFLLDKMFLFEEEINDSGELHFLADPPVVISESDYLECAESFIESIKKQQLKKAVLSRIKKVGFEHEKAVLLFEALEKTYPAAFVYILSSEKFGTWIGATPELLAEFTEGTLKTMSLAGTKENEDTSPWREKERFEQQYVTDFIVDELGKISEKQITIEGPFESSAGPVKHLRSTIRMEMNTEQIPKIIRLLHPTPAVSGLPRKEAIELIQSTEMHDRGFYTGCIGLLGENKSQLFVNLRCCQVQKKHAYLYLGGGFTVESSSKEEWEETENKSKTLLNILQKL